MEDSDSEVSLDQVLLSISTDTPIKLEPTSLTRPLGPEDYLPELHSN